MRRKMTERNKSLGGVKKAKKNERNCRNFVGNPNQFIETKDQVEVALL